MLARSTQDLRPNCKRSATWTESAASLLSQVHYPVQWANLKSLPRDCCFPLLGWVLVQFAFSSLASAQQTGTRVHFGDHDVRSVFFVAKSENANQVHYAVRATADCRPSGASPVFPYWRDLEVGPKVVSPVLAHEERAYGLEAEQRVVVNRKHAFVDIRLRAVPARTIRVRLSKDRKGRCKATATMRIAGKHARLDHVFVELRAFLGLAVGVEYFLIRGSVSAGNKPVVEKVSP